ncbi:MAG: hypothetical protein O3A01_02750 [bacterium]|nr:hypothetical protein [bacterium]
MAQPRTVEAVGGTAAAATPPAQRRAAPAAPAQQEAAAGSGRPATPTLVQQAREIPLAPELTLTLSDDHQTATIRTAGATSSPVSVEVTAGNITKLREMAAASPSQTLVATDL